MTLTQTYRSAAIARPWGWEVRADYATDNGSIYNETLHFAREPLDKTIATATESLRVDLEARVNAQAAADALEARKLLTAEQTAALASVESTVIDQVRKTIESSTLDARVKTDVIAMVESSIKAIPTTERTLEESVITTR